MPDTDPTRAPDPPRLAADRLREITLGAGADDMGAVSIERPELAGEAPHVLDAFPATRTLVSVVLRSNPDAIRSPARSIGNLEFHQSYDRLNEVQARIVAALRAEGLRALAPAAGFPMEMDSFPGRIWVVSHKLVAEAAGMGRMGIHRSVIHPRFGSFINLGTILLAAEVTKEDQPITFAPCLDCKLCVAACPVGAIAPDGHFNFQACYTHNYREFMGGFTDWVEQVADSPSAGALRRKIEDPEQASMWQSLSYGASYKAAYCIAACPAGEDVVGPYLADRIAHRKAVVDPLQQKREPVYVVAGSDAEDHVIKRYPHKTVRRVRSGLRPRSIQGFLDGLPLVFQPRKAKALRAVYHLSFTGAETAEATVTVDRGRLRVEEGHRGAPDLAIIADARSWLAFLRRDRSLPRLLLTRRLRLKGPPRLMLAFGRCFPS